MKFNIANYKGNYAMHCKTEEEAKDFCRYLDSLGRKLCHEKKYTKNTCWQCFTDRTCYAFNDVEYSSLGYYERHGYTILEWGDFMDNKFTKADLKSGDVILSVNGDVKIVCIETGTLIQRDGFNSLYELTDDLKCIYSDKEDNFDDIVAVRRPKSPRDCQFCAFAEGLGELVYERKYEPEEMTLEEICKALGKEIKIVKEH